MNKLFAVIVFLVLMFIGTFFAKVADGGVAVRVLGYAIGFSAFAIAPVLWNKKQD